MIESTTYMNPFESGRTPEEAADLTLRAELMMALAREIKSWNVTQTVAAERIGLSQPRINALLRGKISQFSVNGLLEIARSAKLTVHVSLEREPELA